MRVDFRRDCGVSAHLTFFYGPHLQTQVIPTVRPTVRPTVHTNPSRKRSFLKAFQFPVYHEQKTIMGNRTANGKRHLVRLVFTHDRDQDSPLQTD